jgi:excisionase family DNA binding protein
MTTLSVQEYARQSGQSIWVIYRKLREGKIPGAECIGRRWRIPASAVTRELAQFSMLPPPPKGSVEWYDDRYYHLQTEVDGQPVDEYLPSVTTYLEAAPKPYLTRWRGDIGNREADRIMREAADRGSRVHHACYTITGGGYVVLDDPKHPRYTPAELSAMGENTFVLRDQVEYHMAWKWAEWLRRVRPKVLLSEATVYSLKHFFAGTMDNKLLIDGGVYDVNGSKPVFMEGTYVHDLKTGKSISDDFWMQLSAYVIGAEEGGDKIDGAIITHLNAQTKAGIPGLSTYVRTREELAKDFEDFQAVQKVWRRSNENMKPKIFSLPDFLTYQPE